MRGPLGAFFRGFNKVFDATTKGYVSVSRVLVRRALLTIAIVAALGAVVIALAVAHTVQCPYCIDAYSKGCLEKGADLEQMTEAVHVATAIRGGATLVHGVQMLEHVKQAGM